MANSYDFLVDGEVHHFNVQREAAGGVIEYIFNKSDMEYLKDMLYIQYGNSRAFDDITDNKNLIREYREHFNDQDSLLSKYKDFYPVLIEYNDKTYRISLKVWGGVEFWKLQIMVCYDLWDIVLKNEVPVDNPDYCKNKKIWLRPQDNVWIESQKRHQRDAWSAIYSPVVKEIAKCRKESELKICDQTIIDPSDIVSSMVGDNNLFRNSMYDILLTRYAKIKENCLKIWSHDPSIWNQGKLSIKEPSKYKDALLSVCAEDCKTDCTKEIFSNPRTTNIGHDMPVWMYYDKIKPEYGNHRRKVMIVSYDPLRSGHSGHDLLLSTPWAHHSLEFLLSNPKFSQLMAMRLAHSYLKRGDIVYLTDYKKLYWTGSSAGISLDSIYRKILKKEIEYFNPDFIVSLGDQTAKALTGGWHDKRKKIDHRNKKCSLLPGLCPDLNNIPNVYVKYHTNARSNDNPQYNDPEYWYVAPSEE